MSAGSLGLVGVLSFVFVLCISAQPLWHTDLWDHVNYGRWILTTGQISDSEPLLETSDHPMINTEWGAQVLMACIVDTPSLGPAALQLLYGLLILTSTGAVGWCVFRCSRSAFFGLMASLTLLIVNWQQFLVIRPQLGGVACYCILLSLLFTVRSRALWIVFPILFVVWANIHGSFAMGLSLMGVFVAGQFLNV
ncbi:MAG: hypothetical protein GY758_06450, partial [Fuerstiella sp.]|nr:hypothetical protein [Fuerstiella sp.]